MSVPGMTLDVLPETAQEACVRLASGLRELLGNDLVALWTYGAATFPDRPSRLGDIDTHAVVPDTLDSGVGKAIKDIHHAIAAELGIAWDSWYIAEREARGAAPPRHAFRPELVDHAWALHRAHWIAGQVVALHGPTPSEMVKVPTWDEIVEGLRSEFLFVERIVQEGRDDPGHTAYVVANACRIVYSCITRDVVVSKSAASRWALEHLPAVWHAPIQAAARVYDNRAEPGDEVLLKASMSPLVTITREHIQRIVKGGSA